MTQLSLDFSTTVNFDSRTGWIRKPIKDLLEAIIDYRGKTPPKSPFGIPTLTAANVKNGRIDLSSVSCVSQETYNRWITRGLPNPGDVLITTEAPVGEVASFPGDQTYLITRRVMALRGKAGELDNTFLKYSLLYSGNHDRLLAVARGSTVSRVLKTDITGLEIAVPPFSEQKAIAQILSSLDDKIELNREMNQTLEAMARAIFKSWFVDFDPVRAKMEGRQPAGMDAATAELFPDEFEESALGMIPKGWKQVSLGDVLKIYDSKRIPLSSRERAQRQGNYPYYGAASVMDYVDDYLFEGVYVLMGEDGSVIDDDDHPILQYVWGKFWVNNHAHVLQGANDISSEHLMLFLKQTNIRPYVTGAVQPKLNQGNLFRIPFLLPSSQISVVFGSELSRFYALFRSNCEQSRSLASIRDTLLPKLLSGEIRIKEAEKIAAKAM